MNKLFLNIFLLIVLLLQAPDRVHARNSFSEEAGLRSYMIHDYLECDVAVYGRVLTCEIVDSMGAYTVQKISIQPLQVFKDVIDSPLVIMDFVESRLPLYKAGMSYGFFILKYKDQNGAWHFGKIENSGFSDTAYIAGLDRNPVFLAAEAKRCTGWGDEPAYRPVWVVIRPAHNTQLLFGDEVVQKIAFHLLTDIPQWNLKKDQLIYIDVSRSSYSNMHNRQVLEEELQYLVPLYRDEDGALEAPIVYFLKEW